MTVMEAPQHMKALSKANEVRLRRAELKRRIASGSRTAVPDVLMRPPGWVLTMPVLDLLVVLPRVGKVRAKRWLLACQVPSDKQVGDLSDRQRAALRSVLVGRTG